MSAKQTAELLAAYNLWRRDGCDVNQHAMPEPKLIGEAIDSAVEYLSRIERVRNYIDSGGWEIEPISDLIEGRE